MTEPTPSVFATLDDVIARALVIARPVFPFALVVVAIVLGVLRGPGSAILALAAGALCAAIALAWKSLQVLVGDAPLPADAALGLGAAPVEDAKKREILHALKELDHERSVGKISEEDYHVLSGRFRAEAKEILRRIDATLGPARERAEEVIAAHLRGEAIAIKNAAPKATKAKRRSIACASCGAINDDDARFCKKCGSLVAPEVEA